MTTRPKGDFNDVYELKNLPPKRGGATIPPKPHGDYRVSDTYHYLSNIPKFPEQATSYALREIETRKYSAQSNNFIKGVKEVIADKQRRPLTPAGQKIIKNAEAGLDVFEYDFKRQEASHEKELKDQGDKLMSSFDTYYNDEIVTKYNKLLKALQLDGPDTLDKRQANEMIRYYLDEKPGDPDVNDFFKWIIEHEHRLRTNAVVDGKNRQAVWTGKRPLPATVETYRKNHPEIKDLTSPSSAPAPQQTATATIDTTAAASTSAKDIFRSLGLNIP